MSIFSKRNLLVGIATLVIAVGASAAIWGVPRFMHRKSSINGQVSAYLLDDRGSVDGLLLTSGDQLQFSPETGTAVVAQIKVGDQVSAIGHAGSQSSYGREVRVEQITANGRTILEVHGGPPRKHGPDAHHGPGDRGDRDRRPGPPDAGAPVKTPEEKPATEPARAPENGPDAKPAQNVLPATAPLVTPTPDVIKVTGTIRTHLVNGHGDVDGLILSSGEQVRFSPKVGKLVVAAEQGSTTQLSVEGTRISNDRGIVIRPTYITVGSQTITLGR
jgi:hypothetical protein